jgi:arginyl-tRNA synthetase
MIDPVTLLDERMRHAIRLVTGKDVDPMIVPCRDPRFGDFQSNVALRLAKELGKSPQEISDEILKVLDLDGIGKATNSELEKE